jgi:hypothetical protein
MIVTSYIEKWNGSRSSCSSKQLENVHLVFDISKNQAHRCDCGSTKFAVGNTITCWSTRIEKMEEKSFQIDIGYISCSCVVCYEQYHFINSTDISVKEINDG